MYQPLTFGTRYLFTYLRATNQQTVLVALNLSGRRKRLVLGSLLAHANFRLLLSSTRDTIPPIHGGMLPLEPYEAVVIEVSQG
jgi:hypothetical protein